MLQSGYNFILFFFSFSICRRVSGSNANIAVQLDVFDEQRECDDAQSLQGPSDINLNSHLDVFYTILGQVNAARKIYKNSIQIFNLNFCFLFFILRIAGCRHTARNSIFKYFTTFTAYRSKRSDQRYYLGYSRNTGASCNIIRKS